MGSQTEDAQPKPGDVTRATPGAWICLGRAKSHLGIGGSSRLFGSLAPRPDPALQQGKEALGTEPRGGGSRTTPAPGDPRADADSTA